MPTPPSYLQLRLVKILWILLPFSYKWKLIVSMDLQNIHLLSINNNKMEKHMSDDEEDIHDGTATCWICSCQTKSEDELKNIY